MSKEKLFAKLTKYKTEFIIFVALFLTYSYFFPQLPGWNVNSRLCLTYALVDEGRFEIDSCLNVPELETGDMAEYKGHFYSDKIIGTSLSGAVIYGILKLLMTVFGFSLSYAVKRYLITVFSVCVLSALAGVAMYRVLLLFKAKKREAILLTLAFSIGTLLFPYSTLFISYGPGILFSLLAYRLLLKHRISGAMDNAPMFVIGLFVGLMLFFEYTFGIAVLGLTVYVFYFLKRKVRIFVFLVGVMIPLLIFAAYLLICFDSLSLPYALEKEDFFREGMAKGFMGITKLRPAVSYYITIHPYRGIFVFSPILLVFFIGLVRIWRERRYHADFWLSAFIVIGQVLFNSSYFVWWGGWSSGARHLIPMLGFMFPIILYGMKMARGVKWVTYILGIISVGWMLIITSTDPQPQQIYDTTALLSPEASYNYMSPMVRINFQSFIHGGLEKTLNLGRWIGLKKLWSLLPLIGIWMASVSLFVKLRRKRKRLESLD